MRAILSSRLLNVSRNSLLIRLLSDKIPASPTWRQISDDELPPKSQVEGWMVNYLERISLVDFDNKEGIERLNKAIRSADRLMLVNTDGVEPMDSVLENRALALRDDVVDEGNCRANLLKNAVKVEDPYFVAPPGNIPLEPRSTENTK